MPYLKEIIFNWGKINKDATYPFNIPSLRESTSIKLTKNVTFFVGENGSGKSTLIEAIANKCGFAIRSGGEGNILESTFDNLSLSSIIKLSWLPKVTKGFFLRSETFIDFANYIDDLAKDFGSDVYNNYGGKSLHNQSHGEAFLSLLLNRINSKGVYIFDEPESALSPQRQLSLLRIIWQMVDNYNAQFLIATHSPILMAFPDAEILTLDKSPIQKIAYESTEHYNITKSFLDNRKVFFSELFKND